MQGVSFRYYTLRKARTLGIGGWCANQPNGTVRVIAEGPRAQLEALLGWLGQGPPAAHVARVAAAWLPASAEFTTFDVRYR